ncbi:Tryptophan--tRNA ligase, cytoplasmic [Cucumispora dikerogammari]|nr:Tryptophan--tRNA ligase, cytoplasmic [Cucumispora dikerogammari]
MPDAEKNLQTESREKGEDEILKDLTENMNNLVVTPWTVKGEHISYQNLIKNFGCQPMTKELIERFERVTKKKAHQFLSRGIIIGHRDLNKILDHYEAGAPMYLYTGRGPSSNSMHIGHATPFMFTKYLQDVFDIPLVIQLTDDEKLLCKDLTEKEVEEFTKNNIKDIIAFGFDPKKTFIFSNFKFPEIFTKSLFLSKHISLNEVSKIFGFDETTNIGMIDFPVREIMPCFPSTFDFMNQNRKKEIMCLVPSAIDQDPFFRLARDKSNIMKQNKPATIYMGFLPAMSKSLKMSSSEGESILLNDSEEDVRRKINKYAFSGGRDTLEEHRKFGGDTDKDISFQYLKYFMKNEIELLNVKKKYESGELLSGEIKEICIKEINLCLKEWQIRRDAVTEEVVEDFLNQKNKSFF